MGGPLVRGFVASRRRTTRPNPRKAKRAARKAPSRPGEEPPASPRPPLRAKRPGGRQREVAPRKVPSNRSAPPSSRMAGRNRPLCAARRIAGGPDGPDPAPETWSRGHPRGTRPRGRPGPARPGPAQKEGPATTRVTGPSRHANAPRWSATSCSPTDYSAVPSALGGLTSGFGMGPGVPPPPWSLTNEGHSVFRGRASPGALGAAQRSRVPVQKVARPRLLRVREGRARPISTARLSASRRLHLLPINQVVYLGPYRREDSSRDWLPA